MDPGWQPPLVPFSNRCQVPCQECSERAKRDTREGRATPRQVQTCGLDHEGSSPQSTELLWHVCCLCCSYIDLTGTSPVTGQVTGLLSNLQNFKTQINEPMGQLARTVIKKSVQRVDPERLITILRTMKMKKILGGINHPWNAFQSVFSELTYFG